MMVLVDIIDEHKTAVEYDLIHCGLRLRDFPDRGVTWGDLLALVEQAQPGTALFRAIREHPDRTLTVDFAREIEHTLRIVSYQIARALGGKPDFPEPHYLPWHTREGAYEKPDALEWDDAMEQFFEGQFNSD